MQQLTHESYYFDGFTLDTTRGCLLHGEEEIKLRPKSFTALRYLVQNNRRLISKDELIEAVWPDTAVTDNSLVQCLKEVREALGDRSQHYIKTVPRRGYIFEARVSELDPPTAGSVYTEQVEGVRVIIEEDGFHADENQQASAPVVHVPRRRQFSRKVIAVSMVAMGLAAVLSYLWIHGKTKQPEAGPRKVRSIAVLPFKPLSSADPGDEYLGLGMADTLITKLSNIREITVRPTSAVRRYSAGDQDPVAAGREQRVEAVLEGSIQRSGDKMRLTVRLISVRDGSPLWAYQCDEYCTDILAMQDAVSENVAGALALELIGEEKKLLAKRYTNNPEAYQLYLKGRFFWNKYTKDGFDKGIGYVAQAIEKDPNYALAYAGLADAYYRASNLHLPVREAMPKAKRAAMKALEIDDSLAEAHTALAVVKYRYDWDWAGAEREFKRAIELNPGYATAHEEYCWYLMARERFDEALLEIERARRLDPLSLIVNLKLGTVFFFMRQQDKAIEQYRNTIDLDPDFMFAHLFLGWAYERKGEFPQAVAEFQKAMLLDYTPLIAAHLAHTYAVWGKRTEALKILDELKRLPRQRYIAPYDIAAIHAALGQKDRAFEWLEKAYEEPSEVLMWLKIDPRFEVLRPDPRFAALARRVGLSL